MNLRASAWLYLIDSFMKLSNRRSFLTVLNCHDPESSFNAFRASVLKAPKYSGRSQRSYNV